MTTLCVQPLNYHPILQIFVLYPYGHLILLLFYLFGDWVPGRIPIIVKLLFNALREMIVIRENHHLVIVVHVAEDELQILLLTCNHLFIHLKRLLLLLGRRMVYILAFTLVESIYGVTTSF